MRGNILHFAFKLLTLQNPAVITWSGNALHFLELLHNVLLKAAGRDECALLLLLLSEFKKYCTSVLPTLPPPVCFPSHIPLHPSGVSVEMPVEATTLSMCPVWAFTVSVPVCRFGKCVCVCVCMCCTIWCCTVGVVALKQECMF